MFLLSTHSVVHWRSLQLQKTSPVHPSIYFITREFLFISVEGGIGKLMCFWFVSDIEQINWQMSSTSPQGVGLELLWIITYPGKKVLIWELDQHSSWQFLRHIKFVLKFMRCVSVTVFSCFTSWTRNNHPWEGGDIHRDHVQGQWHCHLLFSRHNRTNIILANYEIVRNQ